MAAIMLAGELKSTLSETVGFKSGLALTRERIIEYLRESDGHRYVIAPDDTVVRIRSEEFEEMYYLLLYRVGRVPSPRPLPLVMGFTLPYRNDPAAYEEALAVAEICRELIASAVSDGHHRTKTGTIDPRPAFIKVQALYGLSGAQKAIAFFQAFNEQLESSPWSKMRSIEWQDTRQLDELFLSEKLEGAHGRFFDQRFVDYLYKNFNDIDKMHWRQFEGLTAEFFQHHGWYVEVGPGRNDGGVDVRVWPKQHDKNEPATILVQCKREKNDVEQIVMKGLWADLQMENASQGLIVTSHKLSPSAEEFRQKGNQEAGRGRIYPINEANRETLKTWLEAMRTPGTGVFMGE